MMLGAGAKAQWTDGDPRPTVRRHTEAAASREQRAGNGRLGSVALLRRPNKGVRRAAHTHTFFLLVRSYPMPGIGWVDRCLRIRGSIDGLDLESILRIRAATP